VQALDRVMTNGWAVLQQLLVRVKGCKL
jgi:hypothetical protein